MGVTKIPEQTLERLKNENVSRLERVQLAEECRREYGYPRTEMARACNIGHTAYWAICKLLRSKNDELIQLVKAGRLSVEEALQAINHPERMEYPFLDDLKQQSADIIIQDCKFALYRADNKLILGAVYRNSGSIKQKLYLLDDLPFVVDTVTEIIQKTWRGELRIDASMRVFLPNGKQHGDIRHHLLAVREGQPIDIISQLPISEGSKDLIDGAHDWRFGNMRCFLSDVVDGLYRNNTGFVDGETLCLYYGDKIYLFDRSLEMAIILGAYYHHPESRDGRMVIVLNDRQSVFLYRFVVASHIYGHMPVDSDGIAELMRQFAKDYPEAEVDHLNAIAQDCRLQNLMLVSQTQNLQKRDLQKRLRKLGNRYFADAVRFDDSRVNLLAGRFAENGKPYLRIAGLFDIDSYLTAMSAFVEEAEAKEAA